jgi:hypothetical protein
MPLRWRYRPQSETRTYLLLGDRDGLSFVGLNIQAFNANISTIDKWHTE